MLILSNSIKNQLKKLANKTDDIFSSEENYELLKRKSKTPKKYNIKNYEKLISQIPDGIYKKTDDLITILKDISKKNTTNIVSFSPITRNYKEFNACKKLSYNSGNIITGRDKEVEQILITLARKNKRGVIIVGEAGTGKTAIVNEINTRLINGTVPFPLKNAKLHHLDIPYLFTHYKEDPISKIVDILEKASEDPKHILFIDEVHQLLNEKFNDILKPYLTGTIRFIGATTVDEYHNIITEDKAIERRFTLVNINEPSIDETIKMVYNTKSVFEDYHNCSINKEICEYLVENGSRFLGHRKNPDKSFDILDKSCSIMNIKDIHDEYDDSSNKDFLHIDKDINIIKTTKTVSGKRTLTKRHIDLAISDIGNIDYNYIKNSLNYKAIVDKMNEEIVNQNDPVTELANVSNIMQHINSVRTRPISILLLVGSHGVGKTKSVQLLSESLYGTQDNIIEYDLAQYTQEFQLTELKGAPPGYVGYQKSGKLIKDLRNNPQSILYLRHINKCHQSISEYLLTSIKNGKMIDSAEREVSLNNTIIIFSVSLEENENKAINTKAMGFGFGSDSTSTSNLEQVINKTILNSVDSIIKFNDLSKKDLEEIFNKNIDNVLNVYSDVNIDKKELKSEVLKNSKNGSDVITNLTSIVPKMIFNQTKKEES